MNKTTLACLLNIVLLFALSLPATARVTVGIVPAIMPAKASKASLERFGQELSKVAGTTVKIRSFDSEVALSSWLLRFQELDAAIVSPAFLSQHPAGTLRRLADLHSRQTTLPLVVRHNLETGLAEQIKSAFLALNKTQAERAVLQELQLNGTSLPGAALATQAEKAAPPRVPTETVVVKPRSGKQESGVQQKTEKAPAAEQKPPPPRKAPPATVQGVPAPGEPTRETVQSVASEKLPEKQPAPGTQAVEATSAKKTEGVATGQAKETRQGEETTKADTVTAAKEPQEAKTTRAEKSPASDIAPKPAAKPRFVVFITLLILLVLMVKTGLIALRWKLRRDAMREVKETTSASPAFVTNSPKGETGAAKTVDSQPLVIEEGQLGPGKVPALLKRCADLPAPVMLQVKKGSCERLVYFAGGQVAGAMTQHATLMESGVRWNKLGSMMAREKLITEEARGQAMELIAREPTLRFGEALLKLGLINLTDLRHALTRQAKVTIYALILFPEGRYQVKAADDSLPPEESISLEVSTLIREASHHQSEWTSIRQALPNLNKALEFSPEGRDKLSKVNLAPQQEATLTLIDGKRTINDLCIESSIMDYEVYRLLYLMVKAGVLH